MSMVISDSTSVYRAFHDIEWHRQGGHRRTRARRCAVDAFWPLLATAFADVSHEYVDFGLPRV